VVEAPNKEGGEDVSWFGLANDTTLLDAQHNCDDYPGSACTVSATQTAVSIPEDCCDYEQITADIAPGGTTSAVEWDNEKEGLIAYCPEGAGCVEEAFMRDVNAGVHDFLGDELGEFDGGD
jgi:hypothetical protein